MASDTSIDSYLKTQKKESISPLEAMPKLQQSQKNNTVPPLICPVPQNHILRVQERETDLPDAPKEETEIPIILDMKKAEEDYKSIDYQVLAFNLWRSKARESF